MCGIVDECVPVFAHLEVGIVAGVRCEVRSEHLCASATSKAVPEEPRSQTLIRDRELLVAVELGRCVNIEDLKINISGFGLPCHHEYSVDIEIGNLRPLDAKRTVEVYGDVEIGR